MRTTSNYLLNCDEHASMDFSKALTYHKFIQLNFQSARKKWKKRNPIIKLQLLLHKLQLQNTS